MKFFLSENLFYGVIISNFASELGYIKQTHVPIPKEVLAVPRPKNSVVIAYGKNKDRYSVCLFIFLSYLHSYMITR